MWRSADLAGVIVACWCLDDHERRDAIQRDGDALRDALLLNLAFHDAKRLNSEFRAFDVRLSLAPSGAPVERSPAVADALEQLASVGRGAAVS